MKKDNVEELFSLRPGHSEFDHSPVRIWALQYSPGTSSSLLLDPESLNPLSPNPTLSENPPTNQRHQKAGSTLLAAGAAPPLKLPVAQDYA